MSALQLVPNETPKRPKRRYTRLTDEANQELERRIRETLASGLPGKADWRRLAQQFEVSIRTVEMRVKKVRDRTSGEPSVSHRTKHVLPADTLERISASRQCKRVWSELYDTGTYMGCYTTFLEATYRQFGHNVAAGAIHGVLGMAGTPRVEQPTLPFMQRFTLDLFSLRAPLADVESTKPVSAALVREASTGVIVFTWVFATSEPTAQQVTTVLAEAMRGRTLVDEGHLFVGGLPDVVFCDNGSAFVAADLNEAMRGLGVRVVTTNSYSSHENGAHERLHGTVRRQFLSALPGSSDGARRRNGELLPDPRPLLTLAEARHVLEAWAWQWNRRAGKDGENPLGKWAAPVNAGQLPRQASPKSLAKFAVEHPTSCQRYREGIRLLNQHYLCVEVSRLPNKRYVLRRWLRDERNVEVFTTDGDYVGVGRNTAHLTAAHASLVRQTQADDAALAQTAIAAARDLGRDEIQAVRTGQPAPRLATGLEGVDSHLSVDSLVDALAGPADGEEGEAQNEEGPQRPEEQRGEAKGASS